MRYAVHTVCVKVYNGMTCKDPSTVLYIVLYAVHIMHGVLCSVSRRIMGWPAKTAITSLCSPSPAALVGVFAKDFLSREVFVKDFSDGQI